MAKLYDLTAIYPNMKKRVLGWFVAIFRFYKIKRYKHRKVMLTKILPEQMYDIEFNVIINDQYNSQKTETFHIQVPATSFFFARKRLERHIRENVTVEVVNFESMSDDM